MKQEKLVAVLIAGCLILGGIALVVRGSQDRRAPVIKVKKADFTYQEGQDYGELLKGVSAEDNRDGDLTDEVFVDRVVQIKDGKAIVYYGVMDKAKNVGTAKRTVNYVEDENAHPKTEDTAEENTEQSQDASTAQNDPAKANEKHNINNATIPKCFLFILYLPYYSMCSQNQVQERFREYTPSQII